MTTLGFGARFELHDRLRRFLKEWEEIVKEGQAPGQERRPTRARRSRESLGEGEDHGDQRLPLPHRLTERHA